MTSPLTHSRLRAVLSYDEHTGRFAWLITLSNRAPAGKIAGTPHCRGYLSIVVDGVAYLAHRLAIFYVSGKWPEGDVDHRDGCRTNNAIANLRPATRSLNMQNQRRSKSNSKTGVLGVSRHGSKFRATVQLGSMRQRSRPVETAEEAYELYLTMKREVHPGCTI